MRKNHIKNLRLTRISTQEVNCLEAVTKESNTPNLLIGQYDARHKQSVKMVIHKFGWLDKHS